MEKRKEEQNRIKFVAQETMDAIPILDANTNITEIKHALPIPLEETTTDSLQKQSESDKSSEIQDKSKPVDFKAETYKDATLEKVQVVKEGVLSKMEALKTKAVSSESSNPVQDEANRDKPNAKAKYSLQLKMMLVISLVIATTVSVIIALATYFFKDDNKKRIQENNLELVRIVNSKVVTDLVAEINKAKILALTLKG